MMNKEIRRVVTGVWGRKGLGLGRQHGFNQKLIQQQCEDRGGVGMESVPVEGAR